MWFRVFKKRDCVFLLTYNTHPPTHIMGHIMATKIVPNDQFLSQTQGPLPHTTADFWRMVVECEVQVIIMASNETEGGKVSLVTSDGLFFSISIFLMKQMLRPLESYNNMRFVIKYLNFLCNMLCNLYIVILLHFAILMPLLSGTLELVIVYQINT